MEARESVHKVGETTKFPGGQRCTSREEQMFLMEKFTKFDNGNPLLHLPHETSDKIYSYIRASGKVECATSGDLHIVRSSASGC
jgi:hypothetical protein